MHFSTITNYNPGLLTIITKAQVITHWNDNNVLTLIFIAAMYLNRKGQLDVWSAFCGAKFFLLPAKRDNFIKNNGPLAQLGLVQSYFVWLAFAAWLRCLTYCSLLFSHIVQKASAVDAFYFTNKLGLYSYMLNDRAYLVKCTVDLLELSITCIL